MPILALALCLASGYLLIALVWPRYQACSSERLIRLSLAPGFGLGIFSAVFFLFRLLDATHLVAIDASLLAVLLILYAVHRRRSANAIAPTVPNADLIAPRWVRGILTAAFVVAILGAIFNATLRIIAHPHGDGWDAFSIWNLHARFLLLGGPHWRDGFSARIPWSHPDYPLLLPAAIAHAWSYLGHDSPAVPAIVGVVFTFSTFLLLVASLAYLRGPIAAMLAGLALSSTPFFVEQGTSQYADVPLSFFILASIVLLHLGYGSPPESHQPSGPLILAGLAAGFAAWTKNEGLLFLLALLIAQLWVFFPSPRLDQSVPRFGQKWRFLLLFILGAAPILIVIAWFKHSIATPGDIFSSPDVMIQQILTPSRYWVIVQWYAKDFFRFGSWWIVPGTVAMIAFYLLIGRKGSRIQQPMFRSSVVALVITFAGYCAIYVITPRDLYWHLRFSLNRLFLQLWPTVTFLFFRLVGRQTLSFQDEGNSAEIAPDC